MNEATIKRTACGLSDEEIDRLGTYFTYHRIFYLYKITFESFVEKVRNGAWAQRFTI